MSGRLNYRLRVVPRWGILESVRKREWQARRAIRSELGYSSVRKSGLFGGVVVVLRWGIIECQEAGGSESE